MEHPPSFPLGKKEPYSIQKKVVDGSHGPRPRGVKTLLEWGGSRPEATNIFTHNMSVWGLYRVFFQFKTMASASRLGVSPWSKGEMPKCLKKTTPGK